MDESCCWASALALDRHVLDRRRHLALDHVALDPPSPVARVNLATLILTLNLLSSTTTF